MKRGQVLQATLARKDRKGGKSYNVGLLSCAYPGWQSPDTTVAVGGYRRGGSAAPLRAGAGGGLKRAGHGL